MSSNELSGPPRPAALKLIIAYDGADFAGSQAQVGQRTVQEEVERALTRLFGHHERATFAGRTDQGVHAAAQVVGVADRRPDLDPHTLQRALNANLPEDVAVRRVERIAEPFHARFDARWREYRYRIWSGPPEPLARRFVWRIPSRVDPGPMEREARGLIGVHDFAAFASGGEGVPWSDRRLAPRGATRRVVAARIHELDPWWGPVLNDGELLEFRVVADAYLPRMVRNIVGALVEVGRGVRPPGWIEELLDARDRRRAGMTAPPHGLILWRVGYGDQAPATGERD